MVYEGDGKLITVLLILVIMLMLFVIPCEPIPLSFKPCRYSISQGPSQINGKDDILFQFQGNINLWGVEFLFTWNGKWSGPRAGAELIWTVPVSMASLIKIALLMSFVKTQPCVAIQWTYLLSCENWSGKFCSWRIQHDFKVHYKFMSNAELCKQKYK